MALDCSCQRESWSSSVFNSASWNCATKNPETETVHYCFPTCRCLASLCITVFFQHKRGTDLVEAMLSEQLAIAPSTGYTEWSEHLGV